mmetsp:Transcript_49662/g.105739  ORF Transcript_49662/g.105739 Transcript_49662/m.105739 type:complete len:199 (-) Transcript_49662:189-785(-)|eukprot:CAMPEP_0206471420 /NCGR_PEP_ID=MMETSP0324_2-20121206/31549_1 /ASSEMBLY_ACC=CAM_ASM_000836 /TAXON_ID=2866 /ORGANISM="Crypthecodinium cohnii, Strain Seligo" /LENGTH=198 /DNA_ID=CAMNT_0053945735 /DNA_START=38 /DNA_END=634 /DNA_ORIENTATION=+
MAPTPASICMLLLLTVPCFSQDIEMPTCGGPGPLGSPEVTEGSDRLTTNVASVDAPKELVWKVFVEMSRWEKWTEVFNPHISGEPEMDKLFLVTTRLRTAHPIFRLHNVLVKVTVLEEMSMFCWNTMGLPIWSRHCFSLCEMGGTTVWYMYQDNRGQLRGVAANILRDAMHDALECFNQNLTAEVKLQDANLQEPLLP